MGTNEPKAGRAERNQKQEPRVRLKEANAVPKEPNSGPEKSKPIKEPKTIND